MWYSLATWAADAPVPSPTEPGLPFEQIGLVLVAMVTGITTIVVTMIQKGKAPVATPVTPAPPPTTATIPTPAPGQVVLTTPTGSFVIPENEWTAVRDRTVRVEAFQEALEKDFNPVAEQVRMNAENIRRIMRKLGMVE